MVARILRGTKAGARGRPQHCYYVLLKVGMDFKYAALQHVHDDYQSRYGTAQLAEQWIDDTSFSGMPPPANQLSDFKPKSVSAVAKAAAQYVKKRASAGSQQQNDGTKKPKAAPNRSGRARGETALSDMASDEEDGEDSDDSDA